MRLNSISNLVLYVALLSMLLASGYAQEADASTAEASAETASTADETPANEAEAAKPVVEEEEPAYLSADPEQWGTYYDPQQEFCGKFDCYRILGFDFETFGSPDQKLITKRYRQISRKWHPDKSKHPKAKERFVVSHQIRR